jgi:hypothetical protein
MPPSWAQSWPSLVTALMAADKEKKFFKLFELPAELRKAIYSYYICDFGTTEDRSEDGNTSKEALVTPAQPPLTKVSRQVRKETLPIFYDSCNFRIQFKTYKSQARLLPEDKSLHFLTHLSPDNLLSIRSLESECTNNYPTPLKASQIIKIDLSSETATVSVMCWRKANGKPSPVPTQVAKDLAVLDKMIQQRTVKRLESRDVYLVRRIVEKSYPS